MFEEADRVARVYSWDGCGWAAVRHVWRGNGLLLYNLFLCLFKLIHLHLFSRLAVSPRAQRRTLCVWHDRDGSKDGSLSINQITLHSSYIVLDGMTYWQCFWKLHGKNLCICLKMIKAFVWKICFSSQPSNEDSSTLTPGDWLGWGLTLFGGLLSVY